ncbi:hypothetical protein HK104_010337 [Borealophlyctis nickersoniae]|nr:hypothetical protein HK104_010337 [Borealophlyctis nickersoniae]
MFAHGASDPSKVDMFMYPPESEDYAEDASQLDTWVFEKFEQLLARAATDSHLKKQLHSDGVVFFLQYLNNIKLVDGGIAKVVSSLNKFYNNDGATAFIVTADHGMSNRGNHGDGHPDNTETPLIAWGAGLAKPVTTTSSNDPLSLSWNLADVQRSDVNQADIAPLMSTLIGIPYPMNSVGVLPLSYLSASDHYKALAVFGNAKQILAQYLVKAEAKRRTEPFFKPFAPLVNHARLVAEIEKRIDEERIEEAERLSLVLIRKCLDGLRYYQTTIFILKAYAGSREDASRFSISSASASVYVLAGAAMLSMSALLFYKQSPAMYYLYVAFPVFFWAESMKQRGFVVALINSTLSKNKQVLGGLGWIVLYIGALEVLLAIILVSVVVTMDTSSRLRAKSGLPFINQVISWATLVASLAIPILDGVERGQHYLRRLVVIYLAFAPVMIFLSISYETLFYFCYANTVLLWLLLERQLYGYAKNEPVPEEYAHLFFINIAFFGTGNIASISSFSLESVYRFTTVFNPFLMGALLLLKILVPFFLLSAAFGVLGTALELPPFALFLLVLSTTDVMTLNFFFLVRDSGSWLEIGTTISHFVIASAFIVFQIILFVVGYLLVGRVLVPAVGSGAKKRS